MGVPSRLTEMQRKFAELLILYEGRKFDYECAIEAGYEPNNARPMASRLQNPEYYPLVVKHIGELREEQRNRYKVNYGRHVTELARIRDSALKHRSFSAAANAEDVFQMSSSDLKITRIFADEAQTLKRYRPRARGRASPILKRSSHITVIVAEQEG